MKCRRNNKGLSLIEVILSMSIFCCILLGLISFMMQNITIQHHLVKSLTPQQNTRFALNYIEKRIRECNQQSLIYHSTEKLIEGKNHENETIWIDLSGNKRNHYNTLLYYYAEKGELRVNKNGEHNVLIDEIEDILVTEVIENQLLAIEVFAKTIDYSVKTQIKLKYR
ncbi:hypothetical protein SAMN05660297_00349 [Natronincola peptidivorans]|uniref:Prepilin-type N-terminal cleavage/methylation domain-containing protein n=1 Tax=Natronincola peptidivorans TaxID=426128 RepID=A0A1H9YQ23_9FIRM|nr:prepilin-type N-terminal cleavage/methylation domain-containing protein [Natronincola peptidivorans]SES71240.1 hypothetical protein SAMN05660297_00349 [Natronincola peptidivorans]